MPEQDIITDEELEKVNGGALLKNGGVSYKYSAGNTLRLDGTNEYIIAIIEGLTTLDGKPAYSINGTKHYVGTTYTDSLTATLTEEFLDQNGYYLVS